MNGILLGLLLGIVTLLRIIFILNQKPHQEK